MGSSKQLSEDVRIKTVHFHQHGEGDKKLPQHLKLPISTDINITRKLKITRTVEVKARSGRPRKMSERMARDLVRNAQKNPCITAKELQKRVADTGLLVHRTKVECTLNNNNLHGRVARKKPCAAIQNEASKGHKRKPSEA